MLTPSNFDLDLPPELIAQTALSNHTASRLLAIRHMEDAIHFEDHRFADLVDYLRPDDLLISNDTCVIKAHFLDQRASGGEVEVLVKRLLDEHTIPTQIRSDKPPVGGITLRLADAFDVTVGLRVEPSFMLHFPQPALDLTEQCGHLPLPSYIEHDSNSSDETRYRTVYARNPGTVAVPMAGLHLDDTPSAKLDAMDIQRGFLTLHVSAGTFQPTHVGNIAEHRMHNGRYEITPGLAEVIRVTHVAGGRIIAVGTTSMRALEPAAQSDDTLNACSSETDAFITPGYRFRAVDLLMTNFHLSKSILLMLVSVLAGMSAIREAYQHAIAQRYRSSNYGDAMLLIRAPTEPGEPGGTQPL